MCAYVSKLSFLFCNKAGYNSRFYILIQTSKHFYSYWSLNIGDALELQLGLISHPCGFSVSAKGQG